MTGRKLLALLLALLLLAAIGGGIWYSRGSLTQERQQRIEAAQQVSARGLIGSEKDAFFQDSRVRAAFARHGVTVAVEKAGSRKIAHSYDPKAYDFGFPSGAPAAAQLRAAAKAGSVFNPFYTPIVLASWRPIADILVANGIARKEGDFYYVVDLPALMKLAEDGKRWRDLKGSEAFATGKAVLPASTDVRSSNSAAMYLALASYIANDQQVVQSQADVDKVMPLVAPLFLRQGFQESSSAGPFEDYLALGMGKAPLLVAYESQLVEYWLAHPDKLKGDMVMLYPRPTIYSKHVVVPYTPAGERVGRLLESDPELRELVHAYGFRTGGDRHGPETWAAKGVQVPPQLVDVIDPPSQEWLERMIEEIEGRFK
ncbi:MAG: substrate-binding domain-containing protein [Pseudomonadota bacterium]|nr:substrate-binding domain-containing protein [Pseudomonadota bacterium]